MPKKHSPKSSDHKILIIVLIVAVVAFGAGFVFARAKYKAQLKTTYNMVMEKDSKITELMVKIDKIQSILEKNSNN